MQTYRTRDEAIKQANENHAVLSETNLESRRYVLRLNRRYAEVPFDYDLWMQPGDSIVGMIERDGTFISFTGK